MMPDDKYVKRPPYQASKGRWGDTIPKMTFLQQHDLPCPHYDYDHNYCPDNCVRECPESGWYTRTECKDMGVSTTGREFVFPTVDWDGSVNTPVPKVHATGTQHNRTPRQESSLLWTQKPVSNFAFTEEYGKEAAAQIAIPTDGLPFNDALLKEAIKTRFKHMMQRQPRRFMR